MSTPEELDAAALVLGVPATSNPRVLRVAYHRAVRRHHPDAGGDADTFRLVQEAYLVLHLAATHDPDVVPALLLHPDAVRPHAPDVAARMSYLQAGRRTRPHGRLVDVAA